MRDEKEAEQAHQWKGDPQNALTPVAPASAISRKRGCGIGGVVSCHPSCMTTDVSRETSVSENICLQRKSLMKFKLYEKIRSLALRGLLFIVFYLLKAYLLTVRLEPKNEQRFLQHLDGGGKGIAVFWHQRIFACFAYVKRLARFQPSAIISASKDGDILVGFAKRVGIRAMRGSSSHKGKEAMGALIADIAVNNFGLHALDGPTGPIGVVKAGIIKIAMETQAPILPAYASLSNAWQVRSWDRMIIPKPFSTVYLCWGEPIYIPQKLSPEEFEQWRLRVESTMGEGQDREDAARGTTRMISA